MTSGRTQPAGAAESKGGGCSSASSARSRWTREAARSRSADRSSARSWPISSCARTSSFPPRPWSTRSGARNRREKARNIIQTYVSHLRKALGHDRIQSHAPGYRLRLDPSELDATRFDALMRDGKKALPVDPNIAVGTLDDALALWRGPALADLADQPSLVAEAARLDELRLEAQEDRIEGLLAGGAQARAIGELETAPRATPLAGKPLGPADAGLLPRGASGRGAGRLSSEPERSWPTSSGSIPPRSS